MPGFGKKTGMPSGVVLIEGFEVGIRLDRSSSGGDWRGSGIGEGTGVGGRFIRISIGLKCSTAFARSWSHLKCDPYFFV